LEILLHIQEVAVKHLELRHWVEQVNISLCIMNHHATKTCGDISPRILNLVQINAEFHSPVALSWGKSPRRPLYRRLGGPQHRSRRCEKREKSLAPAENWTMIPPSSIPQRNLYTDWAIPPHILEIHSITFATESLLLMKNEQTCGL
jgi:hypothetical protein